jgi:hypothetical protein
MVNENAGIMHEADKISNKRNSIVYGKRGRKK